MNCGVVGIEEFEDQKYVESRLASRERESERDESMRSIKHLSINPTKSEFGPFSSIKLRDAYRFRCDGKVFLSSRFEFFFPEPIS